MGDNWRAFARGQTPRLYPAGQLIYLQGTHPTCFYYLQSGRVKSFLQSEDGGERMLNIYHTGSLFGEASFFDELPRVSSAVALTPCEIVTIDRKLAAQAFSQHPELALAMLKYLARTVRLLSAHLDNVSFLSADKRIARYLLSLQPEDGRLSCTHEEIGYAVGVSRVTVSRVLGQFGRAGLLTTGYHSILLNDPDGLSAVAFEEE